LLQVGHKKIDEELKGYLIYKCKKEKSFLKVSVVLASSTILSLLKYTWSMSTNDLIILGIVTASFVMQQRRLASTARRIVVDRFGENLLIERYYYMGISTNNFMEVPIYLNRGVVKASLFGGIAIKAGGVYSFHEEKFQFNQTSILDSAVFKEVANGRCIKYTHKL
jgi:hypothetical protein